MEPETVTRGPVTFTNDHPPTACSKCGKVVKPERILCYDEGLPYCWHHGWSRYCKFLREEKEKVEKKVVNTS